MGSRANYLWYQSFCVEEPLGYATQSSTWITHVENTYAQLMDLDLEDYLYFTCPRTSAAPESFTVNHSSLPVWSLHFPNIFGDMSPAIYQDCDASALVPRVDTTRLGEKLFLAS
jgi:hypothetical protein